MPERDLRGDVFRQEALGNFLDLEFRKYAGSAGRLIDDEKTHLDILDDVKEKALRDMGATFTDEQAFESFLDWYAVSVRSRDRISRAWGELYGAGDITDSPSK